VQVRRDEAHEYVFVMNFTEEKQPVAFETELKDLLTGETLYGETVLEKYEVKIAERSLSSR
jgi:beta-galactosidase